MFFYQIFGISALVKISEVGEDPRFPAGSPRVYHVTHVVGSPSPT